MLSLTDYRGFEAPSAMALDAALGYFRMPAFSFIAGLILGVTTSDISRPDFLYNKFKRLIIPFLFFTFVLLAGRSIFIGSDSIVDTPHHWIYPHSHMWFLPAAFLFFLFAFSFSQFFRLRDAKGSLAFLILALFISFIPFSEDAPFAAGKAADLFPFFGLGIAFSAINKSPNSRDKILIAIALAILGSTAVKTMTGAEEPLDDLLRSSFVLFVFTLLPRFKALALIGKYSFSIYLLHGIAISFGIRLMPGSLALSATGIFLSAIAGPLVFEKLLRKFVPCALPLIGQTKKSHLEQRLEKP